MVESKTVNISFTRREPSITVNEAVFRLLGWREGDLRGAAKRVFSPGVGYYGDSEVYGYVGMSSHGVGNEPAASPETDAGGSADQLPLLLSIEEPFAHVLSERHDEACQAYVDAYHANATPEVLQEKNEAIAHCKAESERAKEFKSAIVRELDRVGDSELRVDFQASISDGELRIYRSGLNRWAQEAYESSVFHSLEGSPSIEPVSTGTVIDSQPVPHVEDFGKSSVARPAVQLKLKDGEALQIDGWKTVKADDVLTFIAFLIEEYCKVGPTSLTKADKANASAIGRHFEKLAKAANNKNDLYGMDFETIRKLVAKARNTKIKKLNGK